MQLYLKCILHILLYIQIDHTNIFVAKHNENEK